MTEAAIPSPLARLTTGPRPTFEDSAALTPTRYRREAPLQGLCGVGGDRLALGLLRHPAVHDRRAGLAGLPRRPTSRSTSPSIPRSIDPQGTRDPAALGQADYADADQRRACARCSPTADQPPATAGCCAASSAPAPPIELRKLVQADPVADRADQARSGCVADDEVDHARQGPRRSRDVAEADRRLNDQAARLARPAGGRRPAASTRLQHASSSPPATRREPELAGIWGAVVGLGLPDAGDAGAVRSRSASPPRSISRSSRRRTAGPT